MIYILKFFKLILHPYDINKNDIMVIAAITVVQTTSRRVRVKSVHTFSITYSTIKSLKNRTQINCKLCKELFF